MASASGSGPVDADRRRRLVGSGSRMRVRIRPQHSLRAIVASQAAGSRGSVPFRSARCAERKVCWAASSASARSRRSAPQSPRPCARRARRAPRSAQRPPRRGAAVRLRATACGALAVATSAAIAVAAVVVALVVVRAVRERQVDRHGLPDERRRQRQPAGSGTVSGCPWTSSVTEPAATALIVACTEIELELDLADLVLVVFLELPVLRSTRRS